MAPAASRCVLRAAALTAAVAGLWLAQAFVAAPAPHTAPALRAAGPRATASTATAQSGSETSALAASCLLAGVSASLVRRSTARRAEADEKKPFSVWEPDTYGNISMDDVKKYGAAGTLSYVITELIFWAVAFPTECIVYLNTAGHWPDFSKPEESAAVFGLVFAASNIARLLLPIRFGAALAMAPWVDENIMQKFGKQEAKEGA
ncbi:unnamed protein product [Symbiodinium natans]|uniref:Mitochondrial fission process protein 1 n=1 Tax=Symbiodinium natans TaxID=878477 RepID=A0A812LE92_9DINO|nr:unnamed protein product [Symbiodinium natans]